MKKFPRILAAAALGLSLVGAAAADTVERKEGRVMQARYLGGTQEVLRFEVNGDLQTFNVTDIVALTFTANGGTVAPAAGAAPVAPRSAPASAAGGMVTIPAGQSLLVRMIDGVDSSKNHVGDIFHATLETDLTVNGVLAPPKATDVHGRPPTPHQADPTKPRP